MPLKLPPVVETSTKSCALSFVSCGKPELSLRVQLYCTSETKAKFCARPAPSRKSVDESVPPTASSSLASVQLAALLERKSARPTKGCAGAFVYLRTPVASPAARLAPP